MLYKKTTYDRYGRIVSMETSAGIENRVYTDNPDCSYNLFIDRPGRNDVTQYYDRRGNIYKTADANGKITEYKYTANELQESVVSGSYSITNSYITYGSENAGKLQSTSDNLKTTNYDYYPDGRLKSVDFDGIITKYNYNITNGIEEKTVTDNNGKAVIYTYNELGWLLRTYYRADGCEDRNEYDLNGNRVNLIHSKGSKSYEYIYGYDAMNRPETVVYDGEPAINYSYDESGNVRTKTESGLVLEYVYDVYSRSVRVDANGQVKERLSYADTCASCGAGSSKLSSEEIAGYGKIDYSYSEEGWLEAVLYSPHNEPPTLIQNRYDNTGNIKKVLLDGQVVTEYGYDSVDFRLNRVYDRTENNTGVYEITYDAVGHKTGILYPNGNKMVYEYG